MLLKNWCNIMNWTYFTLFTILASDCKLSNSHNLRKTKTQPPRSNNMKYTFTVVFLLFLYYSTACITCTLYGVSPDGRFFSMSPTTGQVTYIGDGLPKDTTFIDSQQSTVDLKNKIFYVIGSNTQNSTLYGIDINSNGKIVYSKQLPLQIQKNQRAGEGASCQFDPNTGDIYFGGVSSVINYGYTLHRLKLSTNEITVIVKSLAQNLQTITYSPITAFDPYENLFYTSMFRNYSDLYIGIDVTTGEIKYSLKNPYYMRTMSYDPVTKSIIGLGVYVQSRWVSWYTIVTLKKGQYSHYGIMFDKYIPWGEAGIVDIVERKFYTFMGKNNTDFELVTMSLDLPRVLHTVVLNVGTELALPKSIQYIN
jgi:hypothetical protein